MIEELRLISDRVARANREAEDKAAAIRDEQETSWTNANFPCFLKNFEIEAKQAAERGEYECDVFHYSRDTPDGFGRMMAYRLRAHFAEQGYSVSAVKTEHEGITIVVGWNR